jgi:hypothetical protein
MPLILQAVRRSARVRSDADAAAVRLLSLTALAVIVYDVFLLTVVLS